MSFYTKLTDLLKTNPNFVDDEGELLLAAVQDKAWKLDHDLIRLLLSDDEMKETFFDVVDGSLLFNTNTFIEYISQKNFLDSSYTRFRNRIGLTIDGKYLNERGEVSLAWAYKDCVLEGGQTKEEEKRKEIFFNEVLAQDEINRMFDPKVLTNFTRYTTAGAEPVTEIKRDENGVICDNLIIKGNNLIALHTLKSQFRGKVKLIYIDPPFNTGNDSFGYNDSFSHSAWLTFLKNRLEIARDFLCEDGLFFVHLDDNEDAYVKVVMDELFGRDNYLASVSVKSATPSGLKTAHKEKTIINTKNTIHIYRKSPDSKINPQYSRRDEWDAHFSIYVDRNQERAIPIVDVLKLKGLLSEFEKIADIDMSNSLHYNFYCENANNIFQSKSHDNQKAKELSLKTPNKLLFVNKNKPNEEIFLNGRQLWALSKSMQYVLHNNKIKLDFAYLLGDFWSDINFNNTQNEGGIDFPKGKKPEALLFRVISMGSDKNDLVMDFHLGSGTTIAVAHKMSRQYIGIEQMDYVDSLTLDRLKNVIDGDNSGVSESINWTGGGDFVFCELMRYNQAFLDRIQGAENSDELLQIWQEMAENSFLNWYVNPKVPEDAINDFMKIGNEENGLLKQKELLMELLDKNQLYVNLSEIDDAKFNVSDEDKALNRAFYGEN